MKVCAHTLKMGLRGSKGLRRDAKRQICKRRTKKEAV